MKTLIRTDHKWRPFVYSYEVPAKILASEFDYQDREETIDGFFEYHGCWYHLDQFMRTSAEGLGLLGWDGYAGDSFFSGVAIKLSSDGETYQVGTILCVEE
jgi:hypothetical protein